TEAQPALPVPSTNGHAPAPAVPAQHVVPDGAAAVMMRFQEVMARFLDAQKSVMLGFLGASNGTAAAAPSANGNGHAPYPVVPHANGNGHANTNGHVSTHAATPMPIPMAATNRIAAEPVVARSQASAPAPVAHAKP